MCRGEAGLKEGALPFMDPNIKKLRRIFEYPDLEVYCEDPSRMLVIIGPNGSGTELYGADIFERYGIEAYPFTQKKAAELEAAELRKLKLNSILDPGVVLTRGKDNAQIPLPELAGKRVLLLFAVELFFKSNEFVYLNQKKCSKFLSKLKRMYTRQQGKKDEFEVIYISFNLEEASYSESVADMPWLAHPFHKGKGYKMLKSLFKDPITIESAIVAFGQDWKLMAKSRNVLSRNMRHNKFPFVNDLEIKILKELQEAYQWG